MKNHFKGNRTEANSSQMESKIINGDPTIREHKYMASLQLENVHICSSALIKEGFVVTTGECALFIETGKHQRGQKAIAVLGDSNLSKGQRVEIEKIAFHPRFKSCFPARLNNYWDLAVIKVGDWIVIRITGYCVLISLLSLKIIFSS